MPSWQGYVFPSIHRPERKCYQNSILCAVVASCALLSLLGCTRTQYRQRADRESYCLIDSRKTDPLWAIPNRSVEPAFRSRMYLGNEQDCGPKPLDDPAAKRWMDRPYCLDNTKYYSEIPTRPNSENTRWLESLPRSESGQILLDESRALELGLLHSRENQTQFESVYLSALNLSGNRFEFDTQWFGGLGAGFTATGSDGGDQRLLDVTSTRLGLTRSLAGGGQFATSILNGLVWDFGPNDSNAASAAIVSTFTQPLLRGAFRHVRLENLTQAERNLLYEVRDYARFRRLFYLNVMESYLSLLTQRQAIRNTQTNVENLRGSLQEHEVLVALEMVSQIQVDQIFQQYQDSRLSLLASEQNLIASLDQFKFQLGLPAWVPFELDESLLEPFELVPSELESLQARAQQAYEMLVQYLPPTIAPKSVLDESFETLKRLQEDTASFHTNALAELESWQARLDETDGDSLSVDDRLDLEQQRMLAIRVRDSLVDVGERLARREIENAELAQILEKYDPNDVAEESDVSVLDRLSQLGDTELEMESIIPRPKTPSTIAAWQALLNAIGNDLREAIADVYVAQTQIRLFLISIEPAEIHEKKAITYAFQNRLDLMNSQALVMDAFRRVEVAADALESDLSVSGSVELRSDPNKDGVFRLDSSANRYQVGVEFDGPLNRLNERNLYRQTQIFYQQESRSLIASRDQVANEVRAILRQLELSRLNFQIARQQLVAATRQVDQAQIDLRRSTQAESNLTLFLLQALQGVLNAKNNLISNWIEYRIQKMRLFVATELLYLDENSQWINENEGLELLKAFPMIDNEYFPIQFQEAEPLDRQSNDTNEQDELPEPLSSTEIPTDATLLNRETVVPATAMRLSPELQINALPVPHVNQR